MRTRIQHLQRLLLRYERTSQQCHADKSTLRSTIPKNVKFARAYHSPSPHCLSEPAPRLSNRSTRSLSRRSRIRSYSTTAAPSEESSYAFAFDIDGVLLRSSEPLPGASKALRTLQDQSIPFILLTNGGGKHESERVVELSKKLGVPLTEENFVQSHTPFKQLVEGLHPAEALKDKTILVTGGQGDKVRLVAEKYGFKNVVTPADILKAEPRIWPFNQVFTDYYESSHRPLPARLLPETTDHLLKVDAVLVFNDPRDWALDTQIILDLLLSQEGILGTYSDKNGDPSLPNNGWQQDSQPALYFSNPDLFWAASYHLPRIGQGGFQAALEGVWKATTNGAELKKTIIGKPHTGTYQYAERVLNTHRAQILGIPEAEISKLRTVYMVGDNPESDIRGANEFNSPDGTEWRSLLVKTGVYRARDKPKYKPRFVVDGVLDAVELAMELERKEASGR